MWNYIDFTTSVDLEFNIVLFGTYREIHETIAVWRIKKGSAYLVVSVTMYSILLAPRIYNANVIRPVIVIVAHTIA